MQNTFSLWRWAGIGIAVLIILSGGVYAVKIKNKTKSNQDTTNLSASEANKEAASNSNSKSKLPDGDYDKVAAANLTANNCSGTGSVPIIPPMKLDQVSSILPYGLMIGGHVTPIDHQYYNGTDQHALRDTYDVVAPADGKIVAITHRGSRTNTPLHSANVPSSDEYRFVFMHTCSFLTYADLVTSIDDSVKSKLPAGWTPDNSYDIDVPVKQGQVIGHIGGQTLDFAVWDLSQKPLPGLLVRTAYDNAEPWKVFTAPPTKYFADSVKSAVIAKYVRKAEPIDGKLDYDQEGKLIGSWFKEGSNGYDGGRATDPSKQDYWAGHLSFAPNYVDPSLYEVSLGTFDSSGIKGNPQDPGGKGDSGAKQFGIKGNAPDPAMVDSSSGLVKYELVGQEEQNASGARWQGELSPTIKAVNSSQVAGVLLVQVVGPHSLRVEVFPGKTASQVSGFDEKVATYNRGDDAQAASTGPTSTAH